MPYILVKVRSHYWTKVAMDYDKTVINELGPSLMNRGSSSLLGNQ